MATRKFTKRKNKKSYKKSNKITKRKYKGRGGAPKQSKKDRKGKKSEENKLSKAEKFRLNQVKNDQEESDGAQLEKAMDIFQPEWGEAKKQLTNLRREYLEIFSVKVEELPLQLREVLAKYDKKLQTIIEVSKSYSPKEQSTFGRQQLQPLIENVKETIKNISTYKEGDILKDIDRLRVKYLEFYHASVEKQIPADHLKEMVKYKVVFLEIIKPGLYKTKTNIEDGLIKLGEQINGVITRIEEEIEKKKVWSMHFFPPEEFHEFHSLLNELKKPSPPHNKEKEEVGNLLRLTIDLFVKIYEVISNRGMSPQTLDLMNDFRNYWISMFVKKIDAINGMLEIVQGVCFAEMILLVEAFKVSLINMRSGFEKGADAHAAAQAAREWEAMAREMEDNESVDEALQKLAVPPEVLEIADKGEKFFIDTILFGYY